MTITITITIILVPSAKQRKHRIANIIAARRVITKTGLPVRTPSLHDKICVV